MSRYGLLALICLLPIVLVLGAGVALSVFFPSEETLEEGAQPNNAKAMRKMREQFYSDGLINWKDLSRLHTLDFAGWIETSDPRDCEFVTKANVFCRLILQPGEEMGHPLPNRTCWISKGGPGRIQYQIQLSSGWSNWIDISVPKAFDPSREQMHNIRYRLYADVNQPQAIYVVKIPWNLAGTHCGLKHFRAVSKIIP